MHNDVIVCVIYEIYRLFFHGDSLVLFDFSNSIKIFLLQLFILGEALLIILFSYFISRILDSTANVKSARGGPCGRNSEKAFSLWRADKDW